MKDQELRQAIDACRAGRQDLNLPEFSNLSQRLAESPELRSSYERAQSADRVLAHAMDDVPVPANLADRLLARLRAAAPQPTATTQQVVVSSTAAPMEVAPKYNAPARTSRRAAWRAGLAGLAASLLAVTGWWLVQPRPISTEDMPQFVAQVYDQMGNEWQALQTAPASLAAPKSLVRPRDWQDVSAAFGHKAAAYRFALGGGKQAVLFAVNVELDRVPNLPPARPQPSTGALSVAIWQSGGVAYVLVLKGDARDYQRLFKSQPGATA
jgi:hypothetical protein